MSSFLRKNLQFIKENFRWLLGGFLLTLFSSFGQTIFVAASVSEWQQQFDLSHGEFGRLYMFSTLASAMCLPFVGRLVDVMPEYRMIEFIMPALAVAMLIAAFAPNVIVLAIAIFLLRLLGQGMMTHIALTATGRWFDAQRGRAVSLVVLGHQAGEATLPIIFVSMATSFGYQSGWVACTAALVVLALPFARWAYLKPRQPIHDSSNENKKALTRNWTRREVLVDPIYWILLLGVLAPPFIGTVIFFHQDYLVKLREWDHRVFAGSLTVMAFTTIIFALIAGALIDRFRAISLLPFFLVPLGGACYVMSIDGPQIVLIIAMVLLGISYGMSSTLFGAIWPEIYGTLHLGAIRAKIVAVMVLSTAAGPGLTGTLIDFGYPLPAQLKIMAFYCLAAVLIMVFASVVLSRRTANEELVEEKTKT